MYCANQLGNTVDSNRVVSVSNFWDQMLWPQGPKYCDAAKQAWDESVSFAGDAAFLSVVTVTHIPIWTRSRAVACSMPTIARRSARAQLCKRASATTIMG
jgi:hypothetical protein